MAGFNLDIWNQIDWAVLERVDWDLVQTTTFVFFFEVVLLGILLGLRDRRRELGSRPRRRSPFEAWTEARRQSNATVLASAHTNAAFTTPKPVARPVPSQPRPQQRFIAVGTRSKEQLGELAAVGISAPEPWAAEASWEDLAPRQAKKPHRKTRHRLALPSGPPPIPRKAGRAKSRLSTN